MIVYSVSFRDADGRLLRLEHVTRRNENQARKRVARSLAFRPNGAAYAELTRVGEKDPFLLVGGSGVETNEQE